MKCAGQTGEIEVQDDVLVLTREGRMARISGHGAPPRRIPLAAVSGVHFKPATRLVNGRIQLLLGGVEEPPSGTGTRHPNAVVFTHGQRAEFDELHRLLLAAIQRNREAGIDPETIAYDPAPVSRAQERKQLAEARATEELAAAEVTGEDGQPQENPSAAPVGSVIGEQGAARWVATGYAGANDRVVFSGMSHESGRNAKVTLYPNRLEREKPKKRSALSGANQDVEVTPLRTISSVETKKDGALVTKVTVYASGNNIEFGLLHKDAATFKQRLTELLLQEPTAPAIVHIPAPAAPVDIADQLTKLATLRDSGVLTDEEFGEQKRRLLQ